jgi:hypothetical protein
MVYAWGVITATNFRKHMFEVLERAVDGETVEITWKGSKLLLTHPQGSSKLTRAVRRKALLVPPESIVESDAGLMDEFEKKWARDDQDLLDKAL